MTRSIVSDTCQTCQSVIVYLGVSELDGVAPMICALTAQPRLEVGDVQRCIDNLAIDPLAGISVVSTLSAASVVSQHVIAIVPQYYKEISHIVFNLIGLSRTSSRIETATEDREVVS